MRPLTAASLTLIISALVALTACGGDSDEANGTGSAAAQPTVEPAPSSIRAADLAAEYDLDEASADAKFKGKVVEVTGSITTSGTNKKDVSYVNLLGGGAGYMPGTNVQCLLVEGATDLLSELSPTEVVTVKGTIQGFGETVKDTEGQFSLFISTGKDLTMTDCAVIR